MILEHLKSGQTITPLECLEKYNCFRLGARIFDLKKQGHLIQTKNITQNGKTFAEYKLLDIKKELW